MSLECKHQMLTHDARHTTDDARRRTTDNHWPQKLTMSTSCSGELKIKFTVKQVQWILFSLFKGYLLYPSTIIVNQEVEVKPNRDPRSRRSISLLWIFKKNEVTYCNKDLLSRWMIMHAMSFSLWFKDCILHKLHTKRRDVCISFLVALKRFVRYIWIFNMHTRAELIYLIRFHSHKL